MGTHLTGLARTNCGQATSSRRGRGFASFALMLAGGLVLTACATPKIPDIELYPGPQFAVGNEPSAVVLGDVNGDRVLDLALANNGSNDVSVLLGNGDGSFQPQQRFAAGDEPTSKRLPGAGAGG